MGVLRYTWEYLGILGSTLRVVFGMLRGVIFDGGGIVGVVIIYSLIHIYISYSYKL